VSNAVLVGQQAASAAVRTALLDAASRLLAEEGPAGLSMRRIAGEVGCSTTVLYTTFGGKPQLAEALFREGFDRFARRLAEVPDADDPVVRLEALRWAYRAHALADPHYYAVMFGRAIPDLDPSAETLEAARATLGILVDAAQRCIDAGVLRDVDPWEIAEVLWAASHGAVSLELAGHFADAAVAEARFEALTTAAAMHYVRPPEGSPA
jgi:AcrR family transcriptional regulator